MSTTTDSSNSFTPLTMPAIDTVVVGASKHLMTTIAPEPEALSSSPPLSTPVPFSPTVPTDSRPGKPRSHLNQARARAQIVELRSSLQFSDPVQRRRAAEAMETLKFKDPNLRLSSKADKENKPAKPHASKKVEFAGTDQGLALNAEQRNVVQKYLNLEDGHRVELAQLRLEYENIARMLSTRFFAEKQRADVLQHQLLNTQDQLAQVHTSLTMLSAGQNERLQLLEQENAGLSLALRQTRLELQMVLQNVPPYLPGFPPAPTAPLASMLSHPSAQVTPANVPAAEMKPTNRRTSKSAFVPSAVDPSMSQSRNRSTSAAPLGAATSYNRITLQKLVDALPQLQARGAFPHSVSSPVLPGTLETGVLVATSELRPRADTAPSLLPALELRKASGGANKTAAAAGPTAAKGNPALDALTSAFKITSTNTTPATSTTPAIASVPAMHAMPAAFASSSNSKPANTSNGGNNKGMSKPQRGAKAKASSRSVSGPVKIPSEETENLPPASGSLGGSEKDNWRRPGSGKGKARRATFSRSQRRPIMGDKLNDESMLKITE